MALVFVHGVNVRYNPNNDLFLTARDALFRRCVIGKIVNDPAKALIINPYWGDAAAQFPWNYGGLPEGRYEQFGAADVKAAAVVNDLAIAGQLDPQNADGMAGIDPDGVLLALARTSLAAAVDRLWVVAARGLDAKIGATYAELAVTVAAYALANPRPAWLDVIKNDKEFVSVLLRHATANVSGRGAGQESFGWDEAKDAIRGAVESIRESFVELFASAKRTIDTTKIEARHWLDDIILAVRTPIHKSVATFLGDAFIYFRQREQGASHNAVASIVSDALAEAEANRKQTGEPIIIVAHSMGGNIVYDLLTSTMVDLTVDALVTVGSQVAVMEEMKLFSSSRAEIPNAAMQKVPCPKNVKRWINVFDSTDILGFAAARVFADVEDYHLLPGTCGPMAGILSNRYFTNALVVDLEGALDARTKARDSGSADPRPCRWCWFLSAS